MSQEQIPVPKYKQHFDAALTNMKTLFDDVERRATTTTPGLESTPRDAWGNLLPTVLMYVQMGCKECPNEVMPKWESQAFSDKAQAVIDFFNGKTDLDPAAEAELKREMDEIKANIDEVMAR
ncbi:MAG: hypothetical protein V4469_00235 [Patescibacteria group bacterium]